LQLSLHQEHGLHQLAQHRLTTLSLLVVEVAVDTLVVAVVAVESEQLLVFQ
jgi:hypothetical protein